MTVPYSGMWPVRTGASLNRGFWDFVFKEIERISALPPPLARHDDSMELWAEQSWKSEPSSRVQNETAHPASSLLGVTTATESVQALTNSQNFARTLSWWLVGSLDQHKEQYSFVWTSKSLTRIPKVTEVVILKLTALLWNDYSWVWRIQFKIYLLLFSDIVQCHGRKDWLHFKVQSG